MTGYDDMSTERLWYVHGLQEIELFATDFAIFTLQRIELPFNFLRLKLLNYCFPLQC